MKDLNFNFLMKPSQSHMYNFFYLKSDFQNGLNFEFFKKIGVNFAIFQKFFVGFSFCPRVFKFNP